MMNEIEIMTKHENLSIAIQRKLLKYRFLNINCTDSDLSHVIQNIKNNSCNDMHNDTSDLLIRLV